jgi:hypothetical protein
MWGDVFPHMWGLMWDLSGDMGEDARETKALPRYARRSWHIWQGYVEAYLDKALACG